ncbi:MAG: alpha-ketoglutarate-dependent dioxygenase AlkB, partial [Parvibaculales bacterium]
KADKEKAEILLAHGSLLLMRGTTQSHWEHSLPVMKRANGARINLTFRTIVG